MRVRLGGLIAAMVAGALASEPPRRGSNVSPAPCVLVPAYKCVTEMVPYTVMKTRMRRRYQSVTETVMARVPETTFPRAATRRLQAGLRHATVQRKVVVCKAGLRHDDGQQDPSPSANRSPRTRSAEYCMQATRRW